MKTLVTSKGLSLSISILGVAIAIFDIVLGAISLSSVTAENSASATPIAIGYIVLAVLVLAAGIFGIIRYKKSDDAKALQNALLVGSMFCLGEAAVDILIGVSISSVEVAGAILFPIFILAGIVFVIPAILYIISIICVGVRKSFKGLAITSSILFLVCGALNLYVLLFDSGSGSTNPLSYITCAVYLSLSVLLLIISIKSKYQVGENKAAE